MTRDIVEALGESSRKKDVGRENDGLGLVRETRDSIGNFIDPSVVKA